MFVAFVKHLAWKNQSTHVYNNLFAEKYAEDLIQNGGLDLFNEKSISSADLMGDQGFKDFLGLINHRNLTQFELFKHQMGKESDVLKGYKINEVSLAAANAWKVYTGNGTPEAILEDEFQKFLDKVSDLGKKFQFLNCAFFSIIGGKSGSEYSTPHFVLNSHAAVFKTSFDLQFGTNHYFFNLHLCKKRKVKKPKKLLLEGYMKMKLNRLISEVRQALNDLASSECSIS